VTDLITDHCVIGGLQPGFRISRPLAGSAIPARELYQAEGRGLEPPTGFPAPDFESEREFGRRSAFRAKGEHRRELGFPRCIPPFSNSTQVERIGYTLATRQTCGYPSWPIIRLLPRLGKPFDNVASRQDT
jgi:hypothetical protein